MFKIMLCIGTQHDLWLVGLAALVCVSATFATFYLYSKTPTVPVWKRWGWLAMTGLVAGAGIWTTHFVAMLAFKTGLPTGYAVGPTAASLGVAILGTAFGFGVAHAGGAARPKLAALGGGLVVGLAITLMHYVGMLGYRTTGSLQWDGAYVAASVLIGGLFASLALLAARTRTGPWARAAASGLLTLAIVGMHFTGMSAVTILPDAAIAVPTGLMSTAAMVAASVAVTALILITATGGAALDAAARHGNLRRLREALDVMPEGLAFYDASDRLLAWNTQYEDLCRAGGASLVVGLPFADLLQSDIVHGAYPDAAGRESEWLEQRQAARWGDVPSLTQRTAAGRWLRVTERRTADGGTVSVSVDITDLKRTEAAMAQARDRSEELARRAEAAEAVAGLGHWRLDAATREITWSAQLYRVYGFAPDQVLDLDAVMAMTHPDDMVVATERLARQIAEGGADVNSVTRIVRADGEVRYLAGNSDVERDPDGKVVSVIGTALDVTAQKLAEIAITTSEERFRRLSVNAPDMITEFRLDGVMTYVSPASFAITGFTPEELVGRSFMSLMEPEDGEKVLAMCQAVFRSKGEIAPWPVEFRARHKDGRELWLECKPMLSADLVTGKFTCLNDVVRDITPRKILEASLRSAQADAESAAMVKSEFLANMSHELRTPLTSIIGFTGLAAEQDDLSELSRTFIDRVGNASRALLCTVNDILDFSKLEAGQVSIQPQPMSMTGLARSTLDLFTPQAGAKDIGLILEGDIEEGQLVRLDPDRIRQVLLNLVSNAVKFTAVGAVTVRATYDAAGERLRVEVIDTGAGIAPDKQGRLFQRFSQVDGSLTRAQGGTGLGLAICKGLVEAMDGAIGVDSTPGVGSCFWFEIPAPPAGHAQATGPAAAVEAAAMCAGVRVLVADDHAGNRELARLFLIGVGAEIIEARDGEEAATLASEWPFDVILMDLRMPVLDGLGALQRIRTSGGPNDGTPIVAFTADAEPEMVARLLAQGFAGVVSKPVEPATLFAAIADAAMFDPQSQTPPISQTLELADVV